MSDKLKVDVSFVLYFSNMLLIARSIDWRNAVRFACSIYKELEKQNKTEHMETVLNIVNIYLGITSKSNLEFEAGLYRE